MPELARSDDESGSRREPCNDRPRQEVHKKPGTQESESGLNDANHDTEGSGQEDIVFGANRGDRPHAARDEDRVHGNRADREVSRSPERRVEQERRNGRVEPVNRRKASEERVAHRLRDQHHRSGQARHRIGTEIGALITSQPS